MFFQSLHLSFLFIIFTLWKLDLRVALPNLIKSGAIKPLLTIILQNFLPLALLASFPTDVRQWMKNFRHSNNNILGRQCLHHLTRTLLVPNGSLRSKDTVMAQSPGIRFVLGSSPLQIPLCSSTSTTLQ